MKVTRKIKLNCADKTATFTIELQRNEAHDRYNRPCAWLRVTRYSLNLACIHYGYVRNKFDLNPRLRSEKSKLEELNNILDGVENYLKEIESTIIIKEHTSVITENRNDIFNVEGSYFNKYAGNHAALSAYHVKSIESGQLIAWHEHDVYNDNIKDVPLTIRRNKKGYLEYFAPEKELYDFDKLKALADSEAFKERDFAFFFYDEVNRLLGREHGNVKNMSGLFSTKEAV